VMLELAALGFIDVSGLRVIAEPQIDLHFREARSRFARHRRRSVGGRSRSMRL
jgi:hypothetical protein